MTAVHNQNKRKSFISSCILRILVSVCLILAVFVLPILTESRYKAYLNSFSAVIAKEYYFSSDYLKEDGADYLVNGWDGNSLVLDDIQIRNYDNTLLANQRGQNLNYRLTWTVTAYDSDNNELENVNYTLKVTSKSSDEIESEADGTTPAQHSVPTVNNSESYATHKLTGDGKSKRDVYGLELIAPENVDMADGSYVKVFLSATNSDGVYEDKNQYKRTITATLRYNVSVLENFINHFEVNDSGKTVTTTISTSTIPGEGASQKVYMWWDKDVLDVNRYNFQFNQLFMMGRYSEATVGSGDDARHFGLLEISATSLSLRTFEFEELVSINIGEDNLKGNVKYDDASVTPTVYLGYYLDTTTVGEGEPQE